MRICILSDAYEGSDSPLQEVDAPSDPAPYLPEHRCDYVNLRKATVVPTLVQLAGRGYDLFFNLCDGAWDEDRPGIEVVETLERLGVPYVGGSPAFWEPSREAIKRVCHAWGIATPAGVQIHQAADLERAAALRYPLIVKHPSSYSSIGMTRASRVVDRAGLEREVARMRESFGGALVEEFIEGRELSVLVADNPDDPRRPLAYPPVEIVFPPGETFKHFDMKWVEFEGMDCVPVADPALAERVMEEARRVFVDLHGAGWGRCDVRVDADGVPWFLEINPNGAVFYPPSDPSTADVILDLVPDGHRHFAEAMVRAGLARHLEKRPRFLVRADREGNYGTYAARALAAGEVVQCWEERAQRLVSRRWVETAWNEREREWFDTYAWPLGDDVWVIWSDDPEEWTPINHSCDPSAWLTGLDVTARRPLAAGDEITLDYATFCTEPMREFECACGAADCRRVIRAGDHLEPFVERYGDHLTGHVQRRRAEAAAEEMGSDRRRMRG